MKSRFWSFCLVLWSAVCFGFLTFSAVQAEEATELGEIVVTATRTPEPVEKIASSVTVITAKELKEQGIETLTDALREALGVAILQNGFGGTASISVRGADNGQTVVLIDGVPVYDPSGLGKGDFSWMLPHLSVDQIDRIEIVRGPQSVLYGSNAMAGAINIITKRAKKTGGEIYGEFGSYTTFQEGLSLYRLTENTDLAFSFSKKDSKGISKTVSEPDRDAYHNGNLNLSLDHAFSEKVKGGASLLVSAASHELDGWNYKSDTRIGFFKSYLDWQVSENLASHLDLAFTNSKREYDEGSGGEYKGRLFRLSWQNDYQLTDFARVIAGLDWQKEWADITSPWGSPFDKNAYEWAPFAELALGGEKWVANLGLRYTKHETAGDKVTYRVAGAVFPVEAIKLHASYGTGFRTPGLYQLYDPSYGNKNLKPEESWGYDAGITFYAWDKKASFDVTYFYNKFKNLIDWVSTGMWTGQYQNVSGWSKTYGVEFSSTVKPISWLSIKASYQTLSAKDDKGQHLLRKPRQKANFVATIYCPDNKGSISFRGLYVGKYKDFDWNTYQEVQMDSYFVAYLNARLNLRENLTLTGRIDNLFDKDYQEIYDYKTPGRSVYVGLEYRW
ncbi:TonB-dependent receptor plug domain-containing protein [Thermodesulfatator autotrophicus]|uniref:TonB-dependent receptor n=1 Tax=Thermodesulfatator autotrophicus TaxID=1795632 RepID=A0A177E717_9BACT|nr:TonB-dependent receptor [Thermodesulfatator autotrophicus]OAG27753.1 hypothetical protein TH606_05200 [Thermodesulfatator autotrophicus]